MHSSELVERGFEEHRKIFEKTNLLGSQVSRILDKIIDRVASGATLFWMGNGGSAADSQHLAAELIGRFVLERRSIPAVALTTDTSILTCLSNDYSYDVIFSRQLEALCRKGDVVIGLSTSGNSVNVLRGFEAAKNKGAYTLAMTGQTGGKMLGLVDDCIQIPSTETARIQEMHITIGHILCAGIEQSVFATETQVAAR